MTKLYLGKEKVPSADEQCANPKLLCCLQGQLLASTTKGMLLDYFTCEGEIIIVVVVIILIILILLLLIIIISSSSTWQTTVTLPQDELLLSVAPAQFGMETAVDASCPQDLAPHGEIKPQDTFSCFHSPHEHNRPPRNCNEHPHRWLEEVEGLSPLYGEDKFYLQLKAKRKADHFLHTDNDKVTSSSHACKLQLGGSSSNHPSLKGIIWCQDTAGMSKPRSPGLLSTATDPTGSQWVYLEV